MFSYKPITEQFKFNNPTFSFAKGFREVVDGYRPIFADAPQYTVLEDGRVVNRQGRSDVTYRIVDGYYHLCMGSDGSMWVWSSEHGHITNKDLPGDNKWRDWTWDQNDVPDSGERFSGDYLATIEYNGRRKKRSLGWLVCFAFHGFPPERSGWEVGFRDGNPDNRRARNVHWIRKQKPGPKKAYTPEECEKIWKMNEEGIPLEKMSKKLKKSRTFIKKVLEEQEQERKDNG